MWCDDFYVTHEVITSSTSLQTRLLHQGVSRLLRQSDVDQSQNVSKSADFRCEKMYFCSSESRESRIFGISALKTIVLKNKTKLFSDLQLVNSEMIFVEHMKLGRSTTDRQIDVNPHLSLFA